MLEIYKGVVYSSGMKYIHIILALALTSCVTTPVAPKYVAPSTGGITQDVDKARTSTTAASKSNSDAKESIRASIESGNRLRDLLNQLRNAHHE
jgi:hypothetical protein